MRVFSSKEIWWSGYIDTNTEIKSNHSHVAVFYSWEPYWRQLLTLQMILVPSPPCLLATNGKIFRRQTRSLLKMTYFRNSTRFTLELQRNKFIICLLPRYSMNALCWIDGELLNFTCRDIFRWCKYLCTLWKEHQKLEGKNRFVSSACLLQEDKPETQNSAESFLASFESFSRHPIQCSTQFLIFHSSEQAKTYHQP